MKTALRQPAPRSLSRLVVSSLATGMLLLLVFPWARATELSTPELTTVFSTVHNGFQREKLPDGSLKPVRYVFGEGTFDAGSVADSSLDRVKFGQLAKLLSAHLAKLGYLPGRDKNTIDEVIVVHWGRTAGWDRDGYGNAYGGLSNAYAALDLPPVAVRSK